MHQLGKIFLWSVFVLLFAACTDTSETGLVVQPEDDKISVFLDTFAVSSYDHYVNAISAQCDTATMALGEFYSEIYGSTKAELLIQLAPPVGYEFAPDSLNPTPDSLVLFMYYNSWFGSENSPLEISIYEINKQAIDYDKVYYSDLKISDFTDESILMGRRIITSVDQTLPDTVLDSETYMPAFRYKFSDEQLQRFFSMPREAYQSYEAFAEEFKGLYITTKYGASTMMYFNQIMLRLFYHYDVVRDGKDTTIQTSILFPANREVRRLNRFEHTKMPSESSVGDSIVLAKAPAGIFPRVVLPLGEIRKKVRDDVDGTLLYNVNSAVLKAEVAQLKEGDFPLSVPAAMLMIRESELDKVIRDNYEPQTYDSLGVVALYDDTEKAYLFDLAYLMTYEVRDKSENVEDKETYVLVPCTVVYDSSMSSVLYVTPLRQMGGVAIRSSENATSPLRLKMIYNGF